MQEISNGEKKMVMLCLECAKKQSVLGSFLKDMNLQDMLEHASEMPMALSGTFPQIPEEQLKESLHHLLESVTGTGKSQADSADKEDSAESEKKCSCCGWKYEKWKATGKLGCEECYATFKEDIMASLSQIQHKKIHTGRSPLSSGNHAELNLFLSQSEEDFYLRRELNQLKKSLRESVVREEYGQAAELRDKIRSLEQELTEKES